MTCRDLSRILERKRWLALAAALLVVVMAGAVMAEPVTAEQEGSTETDSTILERLLNNRGTVVLDRDYHLPSTVTVTGNVTLDLKGHTISSVENVNDNLEGLTSYINPIDNEGTLVIEDSVGTGLIQGGILNSGTLTVTGVKVVNRNYGGDAWEGAACVYSTDGTVTLKNVEFTSVNTCVYNGTGATLTINSGEFHSGGNLMQDESDQWVWANKIGTENQNAPCILSNGTLTIIDGDFTCNHHVIRIEGGEAEIRDGTYTLEFLRDTTSNIVYQKGGKLTISGGTYTCVPSGADGDSGGAVVVKGSEAKTSISGGQFSGRSSMVTGNNLTEISGGSFSTMKGAGKINDLNTYIQDKSTVVVEGDAYTKTSGSVSDPYVAKIGDTTYKTLNGALEAVEGMNGDVTVKIYGKAVYDNSSPAISKFVTSIKFDGETDGAEICITSAFIDQRSYKGAIVFKDLTLSKENRDYQTDSSHSKKYFTTYSGGDVTYQDCVFPDGACARSPGVGPTTTYERCTFYSDDTEVSDAFALWVYDNVNCVVDKCTIDGWRGIKMYSEGSGQEPALTVQNTTFTSNVTDKPAIKLSTGKSLTLSNNTYDNTYRDEPVVLMIAEGYKHVPISFKDDSDEPFLCIFGNWGEDDEPTALVEMNGMLYADLEGALAAYSASTAGGKYEIKLLSDIDAGDKWFKLEQIAGKDLVVDGLKSDGTKVNFTGQFVVDANSRNGDEALTISNINFEETVSAKEFEEKVFIWSYCSGGSGTGNGACKHNNNDVTRYAHNVTVKDCDFTLEDGHIALKVIQAYDIVMDGCNVTGGHSAIQATSCTNITVNGTNISGCTSGGISTGTTSGKVTITGCEIDVAGYGIRVGTKDSAMPNVSVKISNCELESKIPVVFRGDLTHLTNPIEVLNGTKATSTDIVGDKPWFVAAYTEYEGGGVPEDSTFYSDVSISLDNSTQDLRNGTYGAGWHEHDAPSCTDKKCGGCSVTIPGKGHSYSTTATCEDRTCTNGCGYTDPAVTTNPTHQWDNGKVCKDKKCELCDAPYPKEPHTVPYDCKASTCTVCGDTVPAAEGVSHDLPSSATCIDRTCRDCGTVEKASTPHDYRTIGYQNVCRDCGDTVDLPFQDDDDDWYQQWLAQQQAKAEAERLAKEKAEREAEEEEQKKVAAVALATGVALIMALLLMSTYRRS